MKLNNTKSKKPLDDLLSLKGKPFADWKEERKYLREKWGIQGRKINPEDIDPIKQVKLENKNKD